VSFRQYLRDNRITVAIVFLAIAAPASWILDRWVEGGAPVNDFVGPPISDYVLYNSKVWSYDVTGLLNFTMISPRMDRRASDESLYINSPVFDIRAKKPGVPDWQGNSPYGWVNKSGRRGLHVPPCLCARSHGNIAHLGRHRLAERKPLGNGGTSDNDARSKRNEWRRHACQPQR
jgi:hypothetical protein